MGGLDDMTDESDSVVLGTADVDCQRPDAGAIIDGGVLISHKTRARHTKSAYFSA